MTGAENKPFENRQIPADELPSYRWIDFQPVAARYLFWALMTGPGIWLLIATGLLVVAETGLLPVDGLEWLPLVPLIIGLFSVAMTWLDANYRSWALREHDLVYRSGVIWKKTVILPFVRIQHVEAVQGPLERKLGLMRLKCFTAGGMTANLIVLGLDHNQARRVRRYLLEQISDADEGGDSAASASVLDDQQ